MEHGSCLLTPTLVLVVDNAFEFSCQDAGNYYTTSFLFETIITTLTHGRNIAKLTTRYTVNCQNHLSGSGFVDDISELSKTQKTEIVQVIFCLDVGPVGVTDSHSPNQPPTW